MSDPRILPKYSPQVRAFLDRHADTGEPPAEALVRVQRQLLARAVNTAPAKKVARRRVAPEFLIAAGLLLATLGGRWWFDQLHRAEDRPMAELNAPEPAEAKAVRDAWRVGDFNLALVLADRRCVAASCAPLKADLAAAMLLVHRRYVLPAEELDKLAQLDRRLAQGAPTALSAQIDQLKALLADQQRASALSAPAKAQAEALYDEATALRRMQNFDAAVIRLERCTSIAPSYANCYKLLGSVYAKISARDSSKADMDKARRAYQRFVELAPPDDDAVPKVRAIIDEK